MYTSPNDKIKVPDFRSLKISDIESFASKEGVDYMIIDSIFDPKGQKGIVIGQDPMPGTMAKSGRTIYLTVTSQRPLMVKLPNLLNVSLKQAVSSLETYGLKAGRIHFIDGLPVVLRMLYNKADVKAGTMLEKGSIVELYVGKGLINDGLIPNLQGMTRDEAISYLESKGLRVGAISFEGNFPTADDSLAATVYRQSPAPGDSTELKTGSFIDIFLHKPSDEPVDTTNTTTTENRPNFEK